MEETSGSEKHPDVHELFSHYNSLYFSDALGSCFVSWNPSRTIRSTGLCSYLEGCACEIQLSEPLLEGRTAADVKNTLLHEMIHAYLYITSNMKDHSYHGPKFKAIMNAINSSSQTDPQRPSGGYNITNNHQFQKKVDGNLVQNWMCQVCGDLTERAMNVVPSPTDCIENMGYDTSCGNSLCHWHKHKNLCSGTYTKVEAASQGRRLLKAERDDDGEIFDGSSNATRHSMRRSQQTKRSHLMADAAMVPSSVNEPPYPTRGKHQQMKSIKLETDNTGNGPASSTGGKRKQTKSIKLQTDNTGNGSSSPTRGKRNQMKRIKLESDIALAAVIPRRVRTPGCRKKRPFGYAEKKKPRDCKRDETEPSINVAIPWLDYFVHESSEEDTEPLINKRTERRRMERLLKEQKGRVPDDTKAIDGESSSELRPGTISEDKIQANEDNIVYLSDN